MRALIFCFATILAAAAHPAPRCDSAEQHQFDFWLGHWQVHRSGKLGGHNTIESILGGCALTEHWVGSGGEIGTSLNHYSAADKQWRQNWVDGNGGRLDLVGGWDAATKRMRLAGDSLDREGKTVRNE